MLVNSVPLVLCPALSGVIGGKVEVTGFIPGSTAVYTCTNGEELPEGPIRICQDSGEWSGQNENYNCIPGAPIIVYSGYIYPIMCFVSL